ncbi:putative amidohydrolase [Kitasatospora sp. MAP12-15]|uniref:carbon-nitrogen hydrolase family protein n=1 Tax=unclassified Kitasatospora TaxID=2633591 RepID=UPI0024770768|nr:carbon-nitrogen hydrolase family protein [Kitasatospora sp. MAP12-44]MDH6112419.1 putative amidohydrolase [Kitasatospora sp. MAP12-44]
MTSPHTAALPDAPLRIAAAQAATVPGDVGANAERAAELIREAGAAGVRLVVFAEKFLTGYDPELIGSDPARYAVSTDDPRLAPIAAACRETGTMAVLGAATRAAQQLFISALVFASTGEVVARYDKQHQYGIEPTVFAAGAAGCTLELDGWRLGLGVCYDSGFPEHARAAALDGCHAYLVGALFFTGGGFEQSRIWFPARAMDNTCFALLANHTGPSGAREGAGGSAIWRPDGRPLIEAGPTESGLVIGDLDPALLRQIRQDLPMLSDIAERDAAVAAGPRVRLTLA